MSGTLRGSIEHRTTASTGSGVRDAFAATVRFFDSHPDMTRIASYKGNGTGGGNYQAFGTVDGYTIQGYTGDASYSGEGAYGVWRWDRQDGYTMYICVQWGSNSSGFQPGKGAPGVLSYTSGVGIQIAMDTSGGDCWNGDIGNAGDDDKGGRFSGVAGTGPVWVANGGTLVVWPRSNETGGSQVTNKQAFTQLYRENGSTGCRYHIMADDDSIWAAADSTLTANYDFFYFGPFTIRDGVVPDVGVGYVMLERCYTSNDLDWNAANGSLAGNSQQEGSIAWDSSKGGLIFYFSSVYGLNNSTMEPNQHVGEWDELEIFLRVSDTGGTPRYGLIGKIETTNLAFVYNIAVHDTNLTKTRIVFGPPTLSYGKVLFPWDGSTIPGSGTTATGVQF